MHQGGRRERHGACPVPAAGDGPPAGERERAPRRPALGHQAPRRPGRDAESGAQRFVPVTVRSATTAGKIVIKNGVETWQAYNTWGGYDLYHGPGGITDDSNRSLAVSLDRPYDASGAFMFLYHERKLIELAERLGLPLAYVTGMDIDADPHLLDAASALFSLGHDEYWSPPERARSE